MTTAPVGAVGISGLAAQTIGILSALVFALNFCLEMLVVFGPGRDQQMLLVALLICLSGWALAEAVVLAARVGAHRLRRLIILLTVQLVLECGRLALVCLGAPTMIDRAYGIGTIDVGMLVVLVPAYVAVFLAISRELFRTHTAELRSAYAALRVSNSRLEELATTDVLTGISNRRNFEERAQAALDRSTDARSAVSLVLFDVDDFKSVNDRHGHQVGDRVLVALTRLVSANIRSDDAFGRWGGEEFALLLAGCDSDTAARTADKLRAVIAEWPFDTVGVLTASFGVAQSESAEQFDSWLSRADSALYEAKARGRDAVVVAST